MIFHWMTSSRWAKKVEMEDEVDVVELEVVQEITVKEDNRMLALVVESVRERVKEVEEEEEILSEVDGPHLPQVASGTMTCSTDKEETA